MKVEDFCQKSDIRQTVLTMQQEGHVDCGFSTSSETVTETQDIAVKIFIKNITCKSLHRCEIYLFLLIMLPKHVKSHPLYRI